MTGKPVLVIRIGKGATGNQGGRLSPSDSPVVVQYKLKTDPNTTLSKIPTQSTTTATTAGNPLPPATFPTRATVSSRRADGGECAEHPRGSARHREQESAVPAAGRPGDVFD